MNRSRMKPTSCSVVPGSSPSGSAHSPTLLPFPLSFPSIPFISSSFFLLFSSSFPFFFSPCFCLFFFLLFWFPLLSPHAHLPFHLCFLFSPFPPFSLFFYFLHRTSFPTQIGVGSSGGDACSHMSPPHSFPHARGHVVVHMALKPWAWCHVALCHISPCHSFVSP